MEAEPPNLSKIPRDDILGLTALILSCYYKRQEFVRVGYYLTNEYLIENSNPTPSTSANPNPLPLPPPSLPPGDVQLDKIRRLVYATEPRVTHWSIQWDSENIELAPPTQAEIPGAEMDVDMEDVDMENDDEEDEDDEEEDDDTEDEKKTENPTGEKERKNDHPRVDEDDDEEDEMTTDESGEPNS